MDDLVRAALLSAQGIPEEWAGLPHGRLIQRLRLRFHLKQYQLAAAADVPASLVCRAEKNADIRLSTLRRLFAAVDCALVIVPAGGLPRLDEQDRRTEEKWRTSPLYQYMKERGWPGAD